ncbi:aspartate/glutamate racemase family protein [Maridesulfovibrio sp. FT414]|uniref:aspartate/glutamate racemase family protein n=1 Tax=Maridesulfovibrio sp. FT414 TaxID=2979469 RepID=UPI003D809BCA
MGNRENVVGVIGGLGNEAMVDLVRKMAVVPGSGQNSYVVYGNSRLAYRPEEVGRIWLPGDGPELRKRATAAHTALVMQYLGCGAVGLACNSAHELFREVMADLPMLFVDMIHETARSMAGEAGKVLVLGVTSLVESGLYQQALKDLGVSAFGASPENQRKVMAAIYDTGFGIKTAKITAQSETLLCEVVRDEYERHGCRKVVLGCTELPLALTAESCARFKREGLLPEDVVIVDASAVLARTLVHAKGVAGSSDIAPEVCPGGHTDWFPPAAFAVRSLPELADVQSRIIDLTIVYLGQRGRTVEGSYMHLPTLFAAGTDEETVGRIKLLTENFMDVRGDWEAQLGPVLERHFGTAL